MVRGVARIHDKILALNDSSALFLTDKQLHFIVMGLLGMGMLLLVYPLFIALSRHHVLIIAWIYVFTVLVMLSFAIEIGQGITNTGNMDLNDVISGLAGFMLLFFIFAFVRLNILGIWHFLFPGRSCFPVKRILSGWPVAGRSSEAEDTACLQDRMSVQAVQCREQKCREYENAQIDQQTLCPLGAPGKIPGNTSAQQRLRHIHGKADPAQI